MPKFFVLLLKASIVCACLWWLHIALMVWGSLALLEKVIAGNTLTTRALILWLTEQHRKPARAREKRKDCTDDLDYPSSVEVLFP